MVFKRVREKSGRLGKYKVVFREYSIVEDFDRLFIGYKVSFR